MRIYYGGPITSKIGKDKKMNKDEVKHIRQVLKFLRNKGHEVFSPEETQNFVYHTNTPDEVTGRDFQYLKYCDLVIIKPDFPPSGGAHIQLGWASAFQKPIVILTEGSKKHTSLVRGLNSITSTNYVDISKEGKFEELDNTIKKFEK